VGVRLDGSLPAGATATDLVLRLPSPVFADPVGEGSLGLTIIRALVDSVERTDDDKEGTVFRVHKRLSAVATSED